MREKRGGEVDRPQSLFDSYLKNFTAKLDWLGRGGHKTITKLNALVCLSVQKRPRKLALLYFELICCKKGPSWIFICTPFNLFPNALAWFLDGSWQWSKVNSWMCFWLCHLSGPSFQLSCSDPEHFCNLWFCDECLATAAVIRLYRRPLRSWNFFALYSYLQLPYRPI